MPIPNEEFPSIAPRGHRPLLGKAPRVVLSSCMVDQATYDYISRQMAVTGLSRGLVLDRMAVQAAAQSFRSLDSKPKSSNRKTSHGTKR